MSHTIYIFDTDGTLIDSAQARIIAFKEAVAHVLEESTDPDDIKKLNTLQTNLSTLESCPVHNMTDLFKPGKVFAKYLMEAGIGFPEGATETTEVKTQFNATFKKALLAFEKKDIAHPSEDGCAIPNEIGGVSTTKSLAMRIAMEAIRIFRDEFEQGERTVPLVAETIDITAKYIKSRLRNLTDETVIAWTSNDNVQRIFHNSLQEYANMGVDGFNKTLLAKFLSFDELEKFLEKTSPEKEREESTKHVISTVARGYELYGITNIDDLEPKGLQAPILKKIGEWELPEEVKKNVETFVSAAIEKEEQEASTKSKKGSAKSKKGSTKKIADSLFRKSPLLALAELHAIHGKNLAKLLEGATIQACGDSLPREIPVTVQFRNMIAPFEPAQTKHVSLEWPYQVEEVKEFEDELKKNAKTDTALDEVKNALDDNSVTLTHLKANYANHLSNAAQVIKNCIKEADYCVRQLQAGKDVFDKKLTQKLESIIIEECDKEINEEINIQRIFVGVKDLLNEEQVKISNIPQDDTQAFEAVSEKSDAIKKICEKLKETNSETNNSPLSEALGHLKSAIGFVNKKLENSKAAAIS